MHIYEPRDDPVTSDVVLTLSLVCTNWRQSEIQQFVAVHIVTKIEHVQLGRLCRMWVIFVASMSPSVERPFDIRWTLSNSTKRPS